MKVRCITITIFLITCLFVNTTLTAEPIIVRANTAWAPMYWLDKNGVWQGESIELYKALLEKANVSYEIRDIPWTRAIKGLSDGSCHIIASLTPTEKRSKVMHFIGPHEKEEIVLVVNEKNKDIRINDLDDMADTLKRLDKKIGIQQDVFYSSEFNNRLKSDQKFAAHFYIIARTEKLHKMTKEGRLFGFFEQRITMIWRVKTVPEYKGLAVHPFTISSTDVYFGVSKKVPADIVTKLKKANRTLIKDGTYQKIVSKWTMQK